ncbi:hypothetical protein [Mucilaginibacter celer]|nr:hypothetical protein [Mucilaginibacter celer]
MKPPYRKENILNIIKKIEDQTRLKGWTFLAQVSPNSFHIVISNINSTAKDENIYSVREDGIYFLKPLKMVFE